jgi:cell volume regulation protein A
MTLFPMFLQQMILGGLLGYGLAKLMVVLVNRAGLEHDGLYAVLGLAMALFVYGLTTSIGGSGFLAVYVAALILAKSEVSYREYLTRFYDGQAWLMQILMFLTLGLQVFPSRIVPVIGMGLVLSLFLMFFARPVSVFLALAGSDLSTQEKVLISWGGLRGSVPIILATFPMIAGVPKAEVIFNLVFFIVLTSALLQGTTVSLVARWLGLIATETRPVAAREKAESL